MCSSDGLGLNRHATHQGACVTDSNRHTDVTDSQKLIVNLVIAAGANLATESLDFTEPCIGRYGPHNTDLHAGSCFDALTL